MGCANLPQSFRQFLRSRAVSLQFSRRPDYNFDAPYTISR
jgi:hypothetical protein